MTAWIGDDGPPPDLLLLSETVKVQAGEVILANREEPLDTPHQRVVWLDAEGVVNGTDNRQMVRVIFGRDLAKRIGILFIQAIGKEPDEDGT
jgi:hypothetical protein